MNNKQVCLIGKEYNTGTQAVKHLLEQENIPYIYNDLEFHPRHWDTIKRYKILSIPVLFIDDHFIVGYSEHDLKVFLKNYYNGDPLNENI